MPLQSQVDALIAQRQKPTAMRPGMVRQQDVDRLIAQKTAAPPPAAGWDDVSSWPDRYLNSLSGPIGEGISGAAGGLVKAIPGVSSVMDMMDFNSPVEAAPAPTALGSGASRVVSGITRGVGSAMLAGPVGVALQTAGDTAHDARMRREAEGGYSGESYLGDLGRGTGILSYGDDDTVGQRLLRAARVPVAGALTAVGGRVAAPLFQAGNSVATNAGLAARNLAFDVGTGAGETALYGAGEGHTLDEMGQDLRSSAGAAALGSLIGHGIGAARERYSMGRRPGGPDNTVGDFDMGPPPPAPDMGPPDLPIDAEVIQRMMGERDNGGLPPGYGINTPPGWERGEAGPGMSGIDNAGTFEVGPDGQAYLRDTPGDFPVGGNFGPADVRYTAFKQRMAGLGQNLLPAPEPFAPPERPFDAPLTPPPPDVMPRRPQPKSQPPVQSEPPVMQTQEVPNNGTQIREGAVADVRPQAVEGYVPEETGRDSRRSGSAEVGGQEQQARGGLLASPQAPVDPDFDMFLDAGREPLPPITAKGSELPPTPPAQVIPAELGQVPEGVTYGGEQKNPKTGKSYGHLFTGPDQGYRGSKSTFVVQNGEDVGQRYAETLQAAREGLRTIAPEKLNDLEKQIVAEMDNQNASKDTQTAAVHGDGGGPEGPREVAGRGQESPAGQGGQGVPAHRGAQGEVTDVAATPPRGHARAVSFDAPAKQKQFFDTGTQRAYRAPTLDVEMELADDVARSMTPEDFKSLFPSVDPAQIYSDTPKLRNTEAFRALKAGLLKSGGRDVTAAPTHTVSFGFRSEEARQQAIGDLKALEGMTSSGYAKPSVGTRATEAAPEPRSAAQGSAPVESGRLETKPPVGAPAARKPVVKKSLTTQAPETPEQSSEVQPIAYPKTKARALEIVKENGGGTVEKRGAQWVVMPAETLSPAASHKARVNDSQQKWDKSVATTRETFKKIDRLKETGSADEPSLEVMEAPSLKEKVKPKRAKGQTLGTGFGGAQEGLEAIGRGAKRVGKALRHISDLYGRNEVTLKTTDYGKKVANHLQSMITDINANAGGWHVQAEDALANTPGAVKSWAQDWRNFMEPYEKGGAQGVIDHARKTKGEKFAKQVEPFAKAFEKIDGEIGDLAISRDVQMMDDGKKVPFKKLKNHFRHAFSKEIKEAAENGPGDPVYDALIKQVKTHGADPDEVIQTIRRSFNEQIEGSLERPRKALNIPYEITVGNRKVPVWNSNPFEVLNQQIEGAARRLGIIKYFDQFKADEKVSEMANKLWESAGAGKGGKLRDAFLDVWDQLNGHARFREANKELEKIISIAKPGENIARVAQLSGAVVSNALGGWVPSAVRAGGINTVKAFAQTAANSLANRLPGNIQLKSQAEIDVIRGMGASLKDVLGGIGETEDISGTARKIGDKVHAATGFTGANRMINTATALAAVHDFADKIHALRSTKQDDWVKKIMGADKKEIRQQLKDEYNWTDAEIDRMKDNGINYKDFAEVAQDRKSKAYMDLARVAQSSTAKGNVFRETPMTRRGFLTTRGMRMVQAYTSYLRARGQQLSDNVKAAKRGNLVPLVRNLVGSALAGMLIDKSKEWLMGREHKDDTPLLIRLADWMLEAGTFGMAGGAAEDAYWAMKLQRPSFVTIAQWEWLGQAMLGAPIKALKKGLKEGSWGDGLKELYIQEGKQVPAVKYLDARFKGPIKKRAEETEEKFPSSSGPFEAAWRDAKGKDYEWDRKNSHPSQGGGVPAAPVL